MSTAWEISITQDITPNDSDKIFTVPDIKEWEILWIWIEYTSSATSGSRLLEVQLQNNASDVILKRQSSITQSESLTYKYFFTSGIPDLKTTRDTNFIMTPLMVSPFLLRGQKLRVWDRNGIDISGDSMIVRIQYAQKFVEGIFIGELKAKNTSQNQTSTNVEVWTGYAVLSVNNASQNQTSTNVIVWSGIATIYVNNANQVQKPDNIVLPYTLNNYYVSTTGNDSNPGSFSSPWRTISHAVGEIHAGDTLNIRGGIYNERVTMVNSGTAGNYIVIQSYGTETAIIDGTAISFNTGGLVNVWNKNYIKLNNVTVRYADTCAIMFNTCNYIEINGCTTSYVNRSSGIGVWWSDHVKVYNNKVINSHIYSETEGGHEESVSIAGTTNFEVSYNEIYMDGYEGHLGNEAIDCKQGSRFGTVHHNYIHDYTGYSGCGGIYIDAWDRLTGDIDIYNNYQKNCNNGITAGSERAGTCENIRIYNNIIYNVGSTGIGIPQRQPPYDYGIRRNIEIYNNTIYKALWNGGAGIYVQANTISNITIRNNIVYFNNWNGEIIASDISLLDYISCDHNLVFGPKYCSQEYPDCVELSDNPTGYPNIYGNITANPNFTSTGLPDFHLLDGSPAINAGVTISLVSDDYDGVSRPQGAAYDIGALEHV